jgi:hypothetical protein
MPFLRCTCLLLTQSGHCSFLNRCLSHTCNSSIFFVVPSTFRKAQKYNQATPNQSSTLSPPNSATALTSLLRAGQTFQQATQVQPLGLCPNQGWSRHRPNKLANTRQNPAFAQLSIRWIAAALARSQSALPMSAYGRYCCKSRRGAACEQNAQQPNRNELIFESTLPTGA